MLGYLYGVDATGGVGEEGVSGQLADAISTRFDIAFYVRSGRRDRFGENIDVEAICFGIPGGFAVAKASSHSLKFLAISICPLYQYQPST